MLITMIFTRTVYTLSGGITAILNRPQSCRNQDRDEREERASEAFSRVSMR